MTQDTILNHADIPSSPQTLLGLDYGIKKMGVAIGNSVTKQANPLQLLTMDNGQPNWQVLIELIKTWQINIIVVGLPLNMDGTPSHLSKRVTKFARRLKHRLNECHYPCEVHLFDERLTSRAARTAQQPLAPTKHSIPSATIRHQHAVDAIAASIILTDWLYCDDAYQATTLL